MKKLLLLTTAATLFAATTSFAESSNEGRFYAKVNAGLSKLNDSKTTITIGDKDAKFSTKPKAKFKNNFLFGLGAGYYVKDNIRMDLMFENSRPNSKTTMSLDFTNKFTGERQDLQNKLDTGMLSETDALSTLEEMDDINGILATGDGKAIVTAPLKIKTDINSLLFNSYVDLFDASNITIFAGAGLGIARVKTKITNGSIKINGTDIPLDNDINFTSSPKTTTNFSYALHLGASTKITDDLHADLAYSWKDFGKAKYKHTDVNANLPLRGHHVTLGLRYDI